MSVSIFSEIDIIFGIAMHCHYCGAENKIVIVPVEAEAYMAICRDCQD